VALTLLVARPVAVFTALAGTATDVATRAFMSWFGPKGVATMTFSLLVLSQRIGSAERIFNLAALTVFCSILAHGATDTAGAEWLADRPAAVIQ
jgi:NhaP-type Na+/H+ or K+/H+ antiporter